MEPAPHLIVVAGPPASGKTNIAEGLAARLQLPWMGKDQIKERLFDSLGWNDRRWSQRCGAASIVLLFQFAEALLAAGYSCIIECNFHPQLDTPRVRALQDRYACRVIQIQCSAAGAVLLERFRRRVESGQRHAGHCDHLNYEAFSAKLRQGRSEALAVDGAVIDVDTTDFERFSLDALAKTVHELWQGSLR